MKNPFVKVVIGLLVLAGVAFVSNPSPERHRTAIKEAIVAAAAGRHFYPLAARR